VAPSGFAHAAATNIVTTAAAANVSFTVHSARLNPATLAIEAFQPVRGGLAVDVAVSSSNTAAGVVAASPLTIGPGASLATCSFDPLAAGTTVLDVQVPPGFTAPGDRKTRTVVVNP